MSCAQDQTRPTRITKPGCFKDTEPPGNRYRGAVGKLQVQKPLVCGSWASLLVWMCSPTWTPSEPYSWGFGGFLTWRDQLPAPPPPEPLLSWRIQVELRVRASPEACLAGGPSPPRRPPESPHVKAQGTPHAPVTPKRRQGLCRDSVPGTEGRQAFAATSQHQNISHTLKREK